MSSNKMILIFYKRDPLTCLILWSAVPAVEAASPPNPESESDLEPGPFSWTRC